MNPIQLIQAVRAAGNPQEFLKSQAQSDPIVNKALQMTSGKNPQEVMQIAQNLAKEQGIDLNAFRRQLGI